MSVCLIISVFCKSCEPICEPEITPVIKKEKQKQFDVQCSVHKSYKTRKWTLLCIWNFKKIWNCLAFIKQYHKMSGFANIFDINQDDLEVPSFFSAGPKKPTKKKEKTAVTGSVDFRGLTSPPSRQKTQTKKVFCLSFFKFWTLHTGNDRSCIFHNRPKQNNRLW